MRIAVALALVAAPALGFYLPGVAPRSFERGDPVDLKVNKVRGASPLVAAAATATVARAAAAAAAAPHQATRR